MHLRPKACRVWKDMVIKMDIMKTLKEELKVEKWQVEAAVKLIDEGNTIPFIARYRKEAHGAMDDTALADVQASAAAYFTTAPAGFPAQRLLTK